jgi:hypothetical protein
VVSVPKPNRGGSPVIEAGAQYVRGFDVTRLAWAVTHYAIGNVREEPTARYLWLAEGVHVRLIQTSPDGGTWWAVATPEWVSAVLGAEDVAASLEQDAQFVRDWCDGEVYCYNVEYEAEWTHNATGSRRKEWQPLAGGEYMGNLVGYDAAVAEARMALADAELSGPVVFPQERPGMYRRRGKKLWRTVAGPATLEGFVVEGHEAEGDPNWLYYLQHCTDDAVMVDAYSVWVALVACATGAMRLDPELALQCRDLVTADWSEELTPLSPEAADAVFHVAVCGQPHH